jgi:hypothetical protein
MATPDNVPPVPVPATNMSILPKSIQSTIHNSYSVIAKYERGKRALKFSVVDCMSIQCFAAIFTIHVAILLRLAETNRTTLKTPTVIIACFPTRSQRSEARVFPWQVRL